MGPRPSHVLVAMQEATHGPLPSKHSPPPPHPFPVLSLSLSKSPDISYRLLLPLPRIPLALAKLSFSTSTASFYSHSATGLPLFFLLLSALVSTAVGAGPKSSNITIIGSVFCDFCTNNSFSKHNYFLHGIFSLSLSVFLSILLLPLTRACTCGKMRRGVPLLSPLLTTEILSSVYLSLATEKILSRPP